MSIGLLVKDADGRVIIDPDTFTVRLVRTVYVGGGRRWAPLKVAVPEAKSGMFATATPVAQYPMSCRYSDIQNANWQSDLGDYHFQTTTRMPVFDVTDGAITLRPPMSGGCFDGNLHIYLFVNV